jgi:hypothetical protein
MGDEHISALGFPEWQEVTGRSSIADLHKPRERCGIYVLGFANGERYVGQAVDVVRRFGDHRKNHADITHMTFKRVKQAELSRVERHCIHTLEAQGLRLRNISLMSVVAGERDLDLVVTPQEQEQWLTGDRNGLVDADQHVQDQGLRERYRRRFSAFMALPHAQDALFILGLYLQMVVPFPRRTELSFWAVSCFPETGAPHGSTLLLRMNLNMQEVFSLYSDGNGLWGSFHLARTPYEAALGPDWAEQLTALGWQVEDHTYAPGGQDQFNLYAEGWDGLLSALTGWAHAEAMCHFNLRLMRKGATYYGRYHSLDLVDAALRAFEERQMELDTWLQLHIQEEGQ